MLTTLCAGIHPNRVLPVVLDCGTDNEGLLNDPLYLGLREKRVRGPQYDKFVDTFIESARKLYPRAYIHFEDFGLDNGEHTQVSGASLPYMLTLLLQRDASWINIGTKSRASTTMSKAPAASPSPPSWQACT